MSLNGEISERHSQGERQSGQHHVGGPCDDVFLRPDLGACQLEVEVGTLMVVACGVTAVLDIEVLAVGLLGGASGEIPLSLLGDDIGDVAALALEVVAHRA